MKTQNEPKTETLPPNTVAVTVTFKEPIKFYLQIVTLSEETKLREKLFGLTDEEKAEKAFENNVEFLKAHEVKKPDGIEDFDRYFAVQNPINERVAQYAVRGFFLSLTPNVDF